jgi:hypothetical protein
MPQRLIFLFLNRELVWISFSSLWRTSLWPTKTGSPTCTSAGEAAEVCFDTELREVPVWVPFSRFFEPPHFCSWCPAFLLARGCHQEVPLPISVVILHTNSPTPFLHFPHRPYCHQGHGTRGLSGRGGRPGREGEK